MPRPIKTIRFRCPKCRKEYMGEQEATANWPTDRVNWRYCEQHRRELFYNDPLQAHSSGLRHGAVGFAKSVAGGGVVIIEKEKQCQKQI